MADTVTVTSRKGFGSRIGAALTGLILGPLLIIGACMLLWYNEHRSANMIFSIKEGREIVQEVQDTASIEKSLDEALVHLSGKILGGKLEDTDIGFTNSGAVLQRNIEYYLWKEESKSETKEDIGGSQTTTTTYSYKKVWTTTPIDSSSFHEPAGHQNPEIKLRDTRIIADSVTLGAYELDTKMKARLTAPETLSLGNLGIQTGSGKMFLGDILYMGQDPNTPALGDMKISYKYLPNMTLVSILAKQNGSSLSEYIAKSKGNLSRIELGDKTASEMFDAMLSENKMITWLLRGLGILGIFVGTMIFFQILGVLASIIPFVGRIVSFGLGIIALIFALSLGFTIIALAWFTARPLWSVGIMLLLAVLVGTILSFKKKKSIPEIAPLS